MHAFRNILTTIQKFASQACTYKHTSYTKLTQLLSVDIMVVSSPGYFLANHINCTS